MYRGLAPLEMTLDPQSTGDNLKVYNIPEARSWRNIPDFSKTFVWQVKPSGIWVILMRQDEQLITSSLSVPLDVDYGGIYDMLVDHKSALLCRLSETVGLIGIAASKAGERFIPMTPGFKGHTSALLVPDGSRDSAEVWEEVLAESDPAWPEGLQKPSIIHIDSGLSLLEDEERRNWLEQCPEGLWLMAPDFYGFSIYEVQN